MLKQRYFFREITKSFRPDPGGGEKINLNFHSWILLQFVNSANITGILYPLTHFMPLISFDTPWKHQKNSGFLMFSGGPKTSVTWNGLKRILRPMIIENRMAKISFAVHSVKNFSVLTNLKWYFSPPSRH